jgi:uncharacterized protein (DUF427 family)
MFSLARKNAASHKLALLTTVLFQKETTMNEKTIKIPGPDHPIAITRNLAQVVVTAGGQVIADTSNALTLREAAYPAVQYIARDDVDMARLQRSSHTSYCPYKGDCAYYSLVDGGVENVAWTYEAPYEAVADIRNYLAFYPDRVDSIKEIPVA